MLKKISTAILAIVTALSLVNISVFADTDYMPKGIKETQKQYENLISAAIEKSEYDEEQIDKEHIFIVEHTSPMQMRKNEKTIWLYVALPIVDSTDISYAHFNENEYVSAVMNFSALKGTETPYGNKLQTYIDENNLSEPSEITNLWIGEGVHIFAHKMICSDKEYIIPYYFTKDSIFNRIKNEDCNMEIGRAYTEDEFLNVCETAAELFDGIGKSENKQDKTEISVDNDDDEVTTKPKETDKTEKDVEEADKIKDEEEKTDAVIYAGVPTEKWNFEQGEYEEELNGVLSEDGRGYSGKYFSAKKDKIYYLELFGFYSNNETEKVKFTVKNKNNGMAVNDANHMKMEYTLTTDGTGGFTTAFEFGKNVNYNCRNGVK